MALGNCGIIYVKHAKIYKHVAKNVDAKYKLSKLQQMNIHIFDLKFFNSQQLIQSAIIMVEKISFFDINRLGTKTSRHEVQFSSIKFFKYSLSNVDKMNICLV